MPNQRYPPTPNCTKLEHPRPSPETSSASLTNRRRNRSRPPAFLNPHPCPLGEGIFGRRRERLLADYARRWTRPAPGEKCGSEPSTAAPKYSWYETASVGVSNASLTRPCQTKVWRSVSALSIIPPRGPGCAGLGARASGPPAGRRPAHPGRWPAQWSRPPFP